jgi:hypothetical protein
MIKWQAFEFQGQIYDLSHLHPKIVNYVQPAQNGKPERIYNVQVIYSLHCFTRRKEKEDIDKLLHYSDPRECRIFDFTRHELSQQLPAIIESLINRPCYHTGKGNFLIVEIMMRNGTRQNYEIYFKANRSPKNMLTIHIESAYLSNRANQSANIGKKKIGFHVILFNTQNNKPIKLPK